MSRLLILLTVCSSLVMTGCGDGQPQREHVWKEQTDTIDKAKDTEQMIKDAAARQRQALESQGG